MMKRSSEAVPVSLGSRSYEVRVGAGLIDEAGRHLAPLVRRQPVLIVTDSNVASLHLARLEAALADGGLGHRTFTVPAGEGSKSFAMLERLAGEVLDTGPERGSALVAFGGGVVGDLAGVAASLILRGIDFIQIPTTLLSQVDSSVGGKTGINTRHGKNLIGAFYQPRLVLADTGVLDTLDRRELLAGYGEVVKYGLLGNAAFFGWLEDNGAAVIAGEPEARRHAIVQSCRDKAAVVAADEREAGRRALLNLGHTFGHALEAETGFGDALLHGEAVAAGTILAFELSARLGLCPAGDVARLRHHFAAVGLPVDLSGLAGQRWNTDALMAHMAQDKKVRDGKITFVLVRGIGEAFLSDEIEPEYVRQVLTQAFGG